MTQIDIRFKSRYGIDNRRPRWADPFLRSLSGVFIVMVSVIILAGCHPGNSEHEMGSTTETPSPSLIRELSITHTPTLPACLQQPGQIVDDLLTSPLLPRDLPVRIYLPPCYDENRLQSYPTLYLLHGLGDSYEQWPRLGLIEMVDNRLMNRQSEPFLIVLPWEQSGQDMVTAVLEVLIPYVESTYHVRSDQAGRALGGISRGGGQVLAIAAQATMDFGAIGLHSTGVLNSFPYLQLKFQEPWSQNQPRLWIDVGERDTLALRAQEVMELFDRLDLEYTWHLFPGEHNDQYWATHLDEYLDWYLHGWE